MRGSLFTRDFLNEGIQQTAAWNALTSNETERFRERLAAAYSRVDAGTRLNEAQTESQLIAPTLEALGWRALPQQQANVRGRSDVPDSLLFSSAADLERALGESQPDRRFRHGHAIVEAKRWLRPLDRGNSSERGEQETPSSQMLRYLTRAEIASDRAIMWGILTNGQHWRLYWQGARSRSEEFIEFDLGCLLGVHGIGADLLAPPVGDVEHALKVFHLLFRAEAFLPQAGDAQHRTFHRIALDESRHWEARVSNALGQRVFDEIFPRLTLSLVAADPQAVVHTLDYREQVKRAGLTLLYRLLFVALLKSEWVMRRGG